MLSRENRWPWVLMALIAVGSAALGWQLRPAPAPEPAEPIYLPGDTVEVAVTDPLVLAENAALSDTVRRLGIEREQLTGDLRDAQGRLAEVTAALRAVTEAAPAEPEGAAVIEDAAATDTLAELTYQARVEAFRFNGLNAQGEPSVGWAGTIWCEVCGPDGCEALHGEPFKLGDPNTLAWEVKPEPTGYAARWYATVHYAVLRDRTDLYDFQFSPDRLRLELGRRWFPRKRFPIRTGAWVDGSAVGVSFGVDW